MSDRRPLLSAGLDAFQQWCTDRGEQSYRAKQVWRWLVERRAVRFDEMSDLSKPLRQALEAEWSVFGSSSTAASQDNASGAGKLLLQLTDGRSIECVLLIEDDRRTACLSTQVGCAMGCVFCASGLDGVERNLSAGEMIEELLHLRNRLPPEERLTHIVVMGMGEPLANLSNLLQTLEFASSPDGLGISARHITISTVGLPAAIRRLAQAGKSYHLAVSLHAPDDELRRKIVPTADKIALADVLAAADFFRETTSRQVTFEYVLLAGINDSPHHARRLAQLIGRRDAFVNLIPFNPVPGLPYSTPAPQASQEFARILRESGVAVKTRKRKGAAIDAACGQLRRRVLKDPDLVELSAARLQDGLEK